jgi:hypothetical protein
MTPLDKPLKRALKIGGHDYVVILTPAALKITKKAHRLGVELKWSDIVSGESALAVALNASLGKLQPDAPHEPQDSARRRMTAKGSRAGVRAKARNRAAPKRAR